MSADNDTMFGALPPPPGVTPDFQNPPSFKAAMSGFNIFLVILISMVTGIRLYTKIAIVKSVSWSDYTVIFGYCTFIVYFGILEKMLTFPAAGRHQWDVSAAAMRDFAYWRWVAQLFYPISIASVRLSICLQSFQLFVIGRSRRFWVILTFIGVNLAVYTVVLFLEAFQCTPVAKLWKPELDGFCLTSVTQGMIIAVGVFNLTGDLLMLAFPLYFIWGLHAPGTRRLGSGALFMVGLLAVIASALRIVFSFLAFNSPDQTYKLTQVAECTVGEVSAGMLVASLISLPAFFEFSASKYNTWIRKYRSCRRRSSGHESDSNKEYSQIQLNRTESAKPSEQSLRGTTTRSETRANEYC